MKICSQLVILFLSLFSFVTLKASGPSMPNELDTIMDMFVSQKNILPRQDDFLEKVYKTLEGKKDVHLFFERAFTPRIEEGEAQDLTYREVFLYSPDHVVTCCEHFMRQTFNASLGDIQFKEGNIGSSVIFDRELKRFHLLSKAYIACLESDEDPVVKEREHFAQSISYLFQIEILFDEFVTFYYGAFKHFQTIKQENTMVNEAIKSMFLVPHPTYFSMNAHDYVIEMMGSNDHMPMPTQVSIPQKDGSQIDFFVPPTFPHLKISLNGFLTKSAMAEKKLTPYEIFLPSIESLVHIKDQKVLDQSFACFAKMPQDAYALFHRALIPYLESFYGPSYKGRQSSDCVFTLTLEDGAFIHPMSVSLDHLRILYGHGSTYTKTNKKDFERLAGELMGTLLQMPPRAYDAALGMLGFDDGKPLKPGDSNSLRYDVFYAFYQKDGGFFDALDEKGAIKTSDGIKVFQKVQEDLEELKKFQQSFGLSGGALKAQPYEKMGGKKQKKGKGSKKKKGNGNQKKNQARAKNPSNVKLPAVVLPPYKGSVHMKNGAAVVDGKENMEGGNFQHVSRKRTDRKKFFHDFQKPRPLGKKTQEHEKNPTKRKKSNKIEGQEKEEGRSVTGTTIKISHARLFGEEVKQAWKGIKKKTVKPKEEVKQETPDGAQEEPKKKEPPTEKKKKPGLFSVSRLAHRATKHFVRNPHELEAYFNNTHQALKQKDDYAQKLLEDIRRGDEEYNHLYYSWYMETKRADGLEVCVHRQDEHIHHLTVENHELKKRIAELESMLEAQKKEDAS